MVEHPSQPSPSTGPLHLLLRLCPPALTSYLSMVSPVSYPPPPSLGLEGLPGACTVFNRIWESAALDDYLGSVCPHAHHQTTAGEAQGGQHGLGAGLSMTCSA